MKKILFAVLLAPLLAGAVEITIGEPLPCDPSGYPIETNDLVKATLMLQARICRLEAFMMSNLVERAETERRREKRRLAAERRSKEDEANRKVNAEFSKWLSESKRKYGRMTLVGYDTNTCERIYRRIDGVEMRKKVFDVGVRQRRRKEVEE